MTQNNLPIESLPEYLESQRQGHNTGSAPVVGMGQIVVPQKSPSWIPKLVFTLVMMVAVGVGGLITYDVMTTKQMTVIVDIDHNADPFQTIPKIVSESGGQVIDVKQNDTNTYEVKVKTRRSISSFLDWLRKSKDVKKADVENDVEDDD